MKKILGSFSNVVIFLLLNLKFYILLLFQMIVYNGEIRIYERYSEWDVTGLPLFLPCVKEKACASSLLFE